MDKDTMKMCCKALVLFGFIGIIMSTIGFFTKSNCVYDSVNVFLSRLEIQKQNQSPVKSGSLFSFNETYDTFGKKILLIKDKDTTGEKTNLGFVRLEMNTTYKFIANVKIHTTDTACRVTAGFINVESFDIENYKNTKVLTISEPSAQFELFITTGYNKEDWTIGILKVEGIANVMSARWKIEEV